MAKYLRHNSGRIQEGQTVQSSAGAGDADKIPSLDSNGRFDASMMPSGFGSDTKVVPASENLSAGQLVNFWDDAGTVKARKADATTSGKEADGFVIAAVTSGNNATVYLSGLITGLSSLTLGARYYLHTTAGGVTTTPPSGSGNVVQYVGRSVSATEIDFESDVGIILA